MEISRRQLAKMIDHTLVKPTATNGEVERLCREAEEHGFQCVCVNSVCVPLAAQLLKGTDIKVCSTISFPFGSTLPEVKAFEARKAVESGAREIDMVINIGALKSGDYEYVKEDIKTVVDVKRSYGDLIVKTITFSSSVRYPVSIVACRLAKEAGADFVKTSTGSVGGATVEDVSLMRKTVRRDMGVKAAGGIRTPKDALTIIKAGANRIGTSTAVAIVEELPKWVYIAFKVNEASDHLGPEALSRIHENLRNRASVSVISRSKGSFNKE